MTIEGESSAMCVLLVSQAPRVQSQDILAAALVHNPSPVQRCPAWINATMLGIAHRQAIRVGSESQCVLDCMCVIPPLSTEYSCACFAILSGVLKCTGAERSGIERGVHDIVPAMLSRYILTIL